jgi:hypothetical protein
MMVLPAPPSGGPELDDEVVGAAELDAVVGVAELGPVVGV